MSKLVGIIAFKIPEMEQTMKAQELGNALFGLQNMNSKQRSVRMVLCALSMQLTKYLTSVDRDKYEGDDTDEFLTDDDIGAVLDHPIDQKVYCSLKSQEISNALYGLQSMSNAHIDTRRLLAAILPAIRYPTTPFTPQGIGMALYGFQSMTCESKEVREIMSVLAQHIRALNTPLNAQVVGNALYGLQQMDATYPEVGDLLTALSEKVRTSFHGPLNSQAIGNAFYGLHHMSSESPGVRDIISALSEVIEKENPQLTMRSISNSMYGLASMSSDTLELRILLKLMSERVSECHETPNAQAVGNTLYGLQNMCSTEEEVLAFIKSFAKQIFKCSEPISGMFIAQALYGLKSMNTNGDSGVTRLIAALSMYIYRSTLVYSQDGKILATNLESLRNTSLKSSVQIAKDIIDRIQNDEPRGIIPLTGRDVGMMLYGLRGLCSDFVEVKALLAALLPSILATNTGFDSHFISSSVHGLQEMNHQVTEVRVLLSFLASKMDTKIIGTMNSKEISNVMFGCRNMESCDEVIMLLKAVEVQLNECTDLFSPVRVALCFNGLQNLKYSTEVKKILVVLCRKLEDCVEPFDENHIHLISYGFKSLRDVDDAFLRIILDKLCDSVIASKITLGPVGCSGILSGLRGCTMSGQRLISRALRSCEEVIDTMPMKKNVICNESSIFEGNELKNWRTLCQELQLYLKNDTTLSRSTHDKLEHSCRHLNEVLPRFQSVVRVGLFEKELYKLLKKEFQSENTDISVHEYVYSFECDVVIRGYSSPECIINVEIDGMTHNSVNRKKFCHRRDLFFESKGIKVIRISTIPLQSKQSETTYLEDLVNMVTAAAKVM